MQKKKIIKPAKASVEYDSQRETRVLLKEMNQGIKTIGEQQGSIVKKLEEHDGRFDKMESEINIVKSEVNIVKSEVNTLKSEVNSVKMAVMDNSKEIKELKIGQQELKTEVNTVKSELSSVKTAVMEVDDKVDKLNTKLDTNISQNEERFRRLEDKQEIAY